MLIAGKHTREFGVFSKVRCVLTLLYHILVEESATTACKLKGANKSEIVFVV
jgi:hypothetical protein